MLASAFTIQVIKNINAIPKGKVATYKQIALLSGKPQGSRGVAWILHTCSTQYKLNWQRVINSKGQISFEKRSHNFREQKRRLIAEGVAVSSEGLVSLKKYQWKKMPRVKKSKQPKMFSGSN